MDSDSLRNISHHTAQSRGSTHRSTHHQHQNPETNTRWTSFPFLNGAYRILTIIVAYVDIILSIMEASVRIAVLVALHLPGLRRFYLWAQNIPEDRVNIVRFAAIIMLLFYLVELWKAVCLLSATKTNIHPSEAIKKAKLWRNVELIVILPEFLFGVYYYGIRWALLAFIIRLTCIFVVHQFIQELEGAIMPPMMPTREEFCPLQNTTAFPRPLSSTDSSQCRQQQSCGGGDSLNHWPTPPPLQQQYQIQDQEHSHPTYQYDYHHHQRRPLLQLQQEQDLHG